MLSVWPIPRIGRREAKYSNILPGTAEAYSGSCRRHSNRKDAFYTVTIELLRQRVEDLVGTLSERPVYEEERDRKELEFNVNLQKGPSIAPLDCRRTRTAR